MGPWGSRVAPTLLVAIAACGSEFSLGTAGLDASNPVDVFNPNDAATDQTTGDGAPDADPPAVADGLLLWLRADLGVTQSNGAVSEWADQSGNQLHARQPDAARQPTLATTGIGGRPTVVFNAEDFLSLPGGFADFSLGVSMFTVVVINETATCVDLVHLSNGPEIDDIALGRHNGRAHYEVLEGTMPGSDLALGRANMISLIHAPDQSASMRLNTGQRAQGTLALPQTITRQSNVIGRSLYADCGTVHGGIAEVMVYRRALDDAERVRVETQLQNRWNCCR